jgi:hypothetical protein
MSNLVDVRIAGIPATVQVNSYLSVKGSYSYNAPSDLDYYGYEDFDYEICDRRGRPAPWLEKKATKEDRENIEQAIRDKRAYDDSYYGEDY